MYGVPETVGENAIPTITTIYVPKTIYEDVVAKFPENTVVALVENYTIEVTSSDETMGSVTGAGEYEEGAEVTLTAVPAEGYEFVCWSDGSTENPYTFTASEDKTLTATFQKIEVEDPTDDVLPSTDISSLDYVLYFNDEVHRAGDFPLALNMKNAEENITAFQCDIYLPEGVTWKTTTDKRGNVSYNLPAFNEDRTDTSYHTITPIARKSDGSYSIIVYSMDLEYILETDGMLMTLPLEISEEMEAGEYNISVRNIVMTNTSKQQTKVQDIYSKLTIPGYMLGDANGDDEINVTDIVYIISYIREDTDPDFIFAAADVNEDTEVNVTDIVEVIDIIRTEESPAASIHRHAAPRKATATGGSNLEIIPLTVAEGTTSATVQLDMNNPGEEITAFQCDVTFPEGVTWGYTIDKRGNKKLTQPTFNAEADRTDASYHTVSVGEKGSAFNIIAYSMDNEIILDEEGAVLDIPLTFTEGLAPGVYDVTLKNIVLTRSDKVTLKPADYTFSILVGSPEQQTLTLRGNYLADALKDYNKALKDNSKVCAIDLSEAANVADDVEIATANRNLLVYTAAGTKVKNNTNTVVGDDCLALVLTDGYDFHAPKAFDAKSASYTRNVANSGWYSIVLPYAAEIPAGVDVEKYESLDESGNSVNFTTAGAMESDCPYIFKAPAGSVTFAAQNVSVAVSPEAPADGAFVGTYAALSAGSLTGSYALRADGTGFGVCNATAAAPAFRAFLKAEGFGSSLRVNHDALTNIDNTIAGDAPATYYDLQGRRTVRKSGNIVVSRDRVSIVK